MCRTPRMEESARATAALSTPISLAAQMAASAFFRLCSPFRERSAASMIFSFSKYSPPSYRKAPLVLSFTENQRMRQTRSSSRLRTAYSLSRILRKILDLRNM